MPTISHDQDAVSSAAVRDRLNDLNTRFGAVGDVERVEDQGFRATMETREVEQVLDEGHQLFYVAQADAKVFPLHIVDRPDLAVEDHVGIAHDGYERCA